MRFRLSAALMLSGAGSVGAQVIWSKLFALGLGHESSSLLLVVSAVMTGLALGALWWTPSRFKGRVLPGLVWLEIVVALGALISIGLAPELCRWAGAARDSLPGVGGSWTAFLLPLLGLAPFTAAMGATLPAMESATALLQRDGRVLGWTYAWNTAGAVFGGLVAAFLLMPALGFPGSLLVLAICNLGAAGLFASLTREAETVSEARSAALKRRVERGSGDCPLPLWRLHGSLFLTGLLGISLEIAGVRALSMVLENTVYSFAIALAAYLAATTLGAGLYHRFLRGRHAVDLLAWLFPAMASGVLIAASFLPRSHQIHEGLVSLLGDTLGAAWGAEALLAFGVFGLPCMAMGAGFSHLASLARRAPGGVPVALAWNYAGGALGAPLCGLFLLPMLGFKWTFLAIALGFLPLIPHVRTWSWPVAVLLAGVVSLLPDTLRLVEVPGAMVLDYSRVGPMATVSVLSDSAGHRSLRVNNRFQMGGTAASVAQRRQAHLPLLLHPGPMTALFLGPGTGITPGAALAYPELQIETVELLSEVDAVIGRFEPENAGIRTNARVTRVVADARRFVRQTRSNYDVVVADLFHPAQDGSGSLYTREQFQLVRNRLRSGGLFCQWLPLHQLDEVSLRTIVATFQEVFSNSELWMLHFNVDIPVMALIGRASSEGGLDGADLEARMRRVDPVELRAAGLLNVVQLLGCRVAGSETLRLWAQGGAINLDRFPRVSFLAPRVLHRAALSGRALTDLLQRFTSLSLAAAVVPGGAFETTEVSAFKKARDHYLLGLVQESGAELGQAIDSYLQAVQESVHFTPAYARLVGVVQAMAPADRARAKLIYERLLLARPDQPLGARLLAPLFEGIPARPQ